MVKFRGIDVSIVSQFDIRKLPEFKPRECDDAFHHNEPRLRSDDNSIASCYIPLYPGSQIWFEYSIDGPHPPQAAYFFKLLHNGQTMTSWDCSAKHSYHGKTTYNIQYIGNDNFSGLPLAKRQAFKFSPQSRTEVGAFDDCIEVRVHRIEYRQKVSLEHFNPPHDHLSGKVDKEAGLCLANGGLLEPGCPKKRYRYQLLDPTDEPYATIRFYYRSYKFLQDQGIIGSPSRQCTISSSISTDDSCSIQSASPQRCLTIPIYEESTESSQAAINSQARRCAHELSKKHDLDDHDEQLNSFSGDKLAASTDRNPEDKENTNPTTHELLARNTAMKGLHILTDIASQTPIHVSQSRVGSSLEPGRSHNKHFDSLGRWTDNSSRSTTENSLEELYPTHVDQAKEFLVKSEAIVISEDDESNVLYPETLSQDTVASPDGGTGVEVAEMSPVTDAPEVKSSPKKLQKKALTLNLEGANFDLEKKKPRRPLSPFTSGGALRRMLSPVPPSAPPAITEFGPRISEEIEGISSSERSESKMEVAAGDRPVRTSRAERGGQMLLSFLAKRMGRAE